VNIAQVENFQICRCSEEQAQSDEQADTFAQRLRQKRGLQCLLRAIFERCALNSRLGRAEGSERQLRQFRRLRAGLQRWRQRMRVSCGRRRRRWQQMTMTPICLSSLLFSSVLAYSLAFF
jgi:hypothetical protein